MTRPVESDLETQRGRCFEGSDSGTKTSSEVEEGEAEVLKQVPSFGLVTTVRSGNRGRGSSASLIRDVLGFVRSVGVQPLGFSLIMER